jgi:hypothetical protein
VNTAMHAGPGVEIEDDIVRLRRRKLEYEADAARRAGPDRTRTRHAGTATQAVSKPAAVGRMFSSLIRGLRRRAALLRTRRPRGDRPASIPRIRWYS